MIKKYKNNRERRKEKIKATITGTEKRPRLVVFRSNKHIYCQLIDDSNKKTIVASSYSDVKDAKGKLVIAKKVGELVAEKALKKGVSEIVFDRGGFKYHGRVKAIAEAARAKGLKF